MKRSTKYAVLIISSTAVAAAAASLASQWRAITDSAVEDFPELDPKRVRKTTRRLFTKIVLHQVPDCSDYGDEQMTQLFMDEYHLKYPVK